MGLGDLDPAKVLKPITAIYNNVVCAVKLISKAQKCMLYYILDVIGYTLYLPVMIFFWLFSLQSIEREIFKGLDFVDDTIYGVAGFHIFRYPNDLLNDCYRCKNKKEKKGESWLDKYLSDDTSTETRVTFFEVLVFFCLVGFIGYSGYYSMNIKKYT